MAYLTNYLPFLSSAEKEKAAWESPEFEEWKKLRTECDVMLERGCFKGDSEELSRPEKLVLQKEKRLLDTIWKKYQLVPCEMKYSALKERVDRSTGYSRKISFQECSRDSRAEKLVWFCNYPEVALSELRNAADKLSLMILPLSYLDVRKLENILDNIGQNSLYVDYVEKMASSIAAYTEQELYVLCPVSVYDLMQVEEDEEQRSEVLFGGELLRVKALLDTIAGIQRNLFAILKGDEGDTDVWEIARGGECSENELIHLKILIETIMPIQRSLLNMVTNRKDINSWMEKMRNNHCKEVSRILGDLAREMSWSEEAKEALKESFPVKIKDSRRTSWVISEAVAMTSLMFFALPKGTSLLYGDEVARVIDYKGVDMPESFYDDRGFVKQPNSAEIMNNSCFDKIGLLLEKEG